MHSSEGIEVGLGAEVRLIGVTLSAEVRLIGVTLSAKVRLIGILTFQTCGVAHWEDPSDPKVEIQSSHFKKIRK